MYCRKCGAKIEDGDKFCTNCGYKIKITSDPVLADKTGKTKKTLSRKKDYDDLNLDDYEEFHQRDYDGPDDDDDLDEDKEEGKDKFLTICMGIVGVAIVCVIIWGLVTFSGLKTSSSKTKNEETKARVTVTATVSPTRKVTATPTQAATATPTQAVTVTPTQTVTAAPTQAVTSAPTASANQNSSSEITGAYVFPDSDSRVLSEAELNGLSAWELRVARNEIYARHGRTFQSSELQNYFNAQSWYQASSSYDDSQLSQTELKNAKLIADYESSHASE